MKSDLSKFLIIHWDAIVASTVSCIFLYYYTRHSGIGVSPDSVMYLSTANNIRDHLSFTDFNNTPLVDFPIGYPTFLAIASFITGIEVIHLLPVINGLLFCGVLIMLSVIILGYQKTSLLYKTCFLSIIACSPCLLEVYTMLWSETFFLFLLLLFIIAIRRYQMFPSGINVIIAAMIACIAFVTRYAGISIVASGLFLLLFDGDLTIIKKIKHIFLFGIISCSLVTVNLIRNIYAAGHLAGIREKAIRSLSENLQQIGTTIAEWLPFCNGHEKGVTILFVLILLLGICFLLYRCLQQQYFHTYETIIYCFFVVYSTFIITIATFSRFENLSSRLLSPLYIPMLLLVSHWVVVGMKRFVRIKRITLLVLLLVLYLGFHYHHYRLNAEAWEGIKDAGIPGYTEDSWAKSPTVAYIKANKDHFTSPVFANANDGVYFLTGIHASPLPHKEIKQEVDAFLQQKSFYLIWFADGENQDLVSLDFIRQQKKLTLVQELDGNKIYFFTDTTNRNLVR